MKIQYTIPATVTGGNERNILKPVKTLFRLWLYIREAKKSKAKFIVIFF